MNHSGLYRVECRWDTILNVAAADSTRQVH
jgi:hypothetical protein